MTNTKQKLKKAVLTAGIAAMSLLPTKGDSQENNIDDWKQKGFSGWTIGNDTDSTTEIKKTFKLNSYGYNRYNGMLSLIRQPLLEAAKAQGYTDEQIKKEFMNEAFWHVDVLGDADLDGTKFNTKDGRVQFVEKPKDSMPFTILRVYPHGGTMMGHGFYFLILEDLDKDGVQTNKSKIVAVSDSEISVKRLRNGTFKLTYSLGINERNKEFVLSRPHYTRADGELERTDFNTPLAAKYGRGGKKKETIINANGFEVNPEKGSFVKMFNDIKDR